LTPDRRRKATRRRGVIRLLGLIGVSMYPINNKEGLFKREAAKESQSPKGLFII
jgi:hypothetical protein